MNAIERRVACPSCTREIRVTETELLDKRGFCPACDARFDLLPEMFIGDGPMRSIEVVKSALPDVPPSGKIFMQGSNLVVATAKPFPAHTLAFSVFWYGFLAFWMTMAARSSLMFAAFGLIFVFFGLIPLRGALREIRGRATLELGPTMLAVEQRGALLTWRDDVAWEDIVAARCEEAPVPTMNRQKNTAPEMGQRLAIIRRGAEPIYVAEGLGHTRDALHWVAAKIEQTARVARRR